MTVVAGKLQALQQALFHAAAAACGHAGERRGLWFNRYRSAAELTFASAHHSELVIEAVLTCNPVLAESYDIGIQAVDLLFDAAVAVQEGRVDQLKLQRFDRDYLVRALEGLMPNIGDQYHIRLENCRADAHPAVTFDANTRRRLRSYILDQEQSFDAEEAVIVGELIKIHVNAGEDKITVRCDQRDIDCFYSDALRDQVANLIAGSIVQVTGLATVDASRHVVKLHRLLDVEPVSMEPLRIGRFEHDGRVFELNNPIAVNLEYTDGLWVYHHPDLNLWGYANRREDALHDLHQSFAYVYRDIAEESEENLDAVAQMLRQRLRRLVSKTSGEAVHA